MDKKQFDNAKKDADKCITSTIYFHYYIKLWKKIDGYNFSSLKTWMRKNTTKKNIYKKFETENAKKNLSSVYFSGHNSLRRGSGRGSLSARKKIYIRKIVKRNTVKVPPSLSYLPEYLHNDSN